MTDENTTTTNNPDEQEQPVSPVEEAKKVLESIKEERVKLEEANKKAQEIQANSLLSGTAGGHIESQKLSPEQQKLNGAKDFFKGTALEKAIKQANE